MSGQRYTWILDTERRTQSRHMRRWQHLTRMEVRSQLGGHWLGQRLRSPQQRLAGPRAPGWRGSGPLGVLSRCGVCPVSLRPGSTRFARPRSTLSRTLFWVPCGRCSPGLLICHSPTSSPSSPDPDNSAQNAGRFSTAICGTRTPANTSAVELGTRGSKYYLPKAASSSAHPRHLAVPPFCSTSVSGL